MAGSEKSESHFVREIKRICCTKVIIPQKMNPKIEIPKIFFRRGGGAMEQEVDLFGQPLFLSFH